MNNSTPQYNESLMRYLDGELNDSEKEIFEKQLATDAALQQELKDLLIAREAIRAYGLTKEVAGIHQTMMTELKVPETPVKKINKTFRYGLAIAASILLAFILFEAYHFYTLSPERLFAQQYSAFELPTPRGTTTELPAIEKAYREKNYTNVIAIFETGSAFGPRELFITAIAYLETKNTQKAINVLQSIIEKNKVNKTNILNDEAEYYLALAHLRNKEYDQAVTLMKKMHDEPDHLYKEKFTTKYIRDVRMLRWKDR